MSTRARLLLIDDDEALRRSLARVLGASFDVTQAADGVAALEVLAASEFDVVVTDLEMPRLSGDGVVAWLRANRPALAEHVVVISAGSADPARGAWLRAYDASLVVRKPAGVEEIIAAVRRALERGAT